MLGLQDICKIDEMALRSFRAQVGHRPLVLDRANKGLEHEVEGPGVGEIRAPAVGTFELAVVCRRELVRSPALLAGAAVDKRVGEILEVARGFPDLRARQDGRGPARRLPSAAGPSNATTPLSRCAPTRPRGGRSHRSSGTRHKFRRTGTRIPAPCTDGPVLPWKQACGKASGPVANGGLDMAGSIWPGPYGRVLPLQY